MRLIAHRGFAANRPENTRRAVEEAVAVADEVEVDVRRCGSGELVVIHDERVDRVTDAEGRVDEMDLAELRALDVLGTGEGVPTLREVLEVVPDHVGVTLDVKVQDTADDALPEIASRHPYTVVSSFSADVLADYRDAAPDVSRALISDVGDGHPVEVADGLDCDYVHLETDACTDRRVTEAHRAGMSVNAWTVETRSGAEAMAELGVDGVIADRWGVLPGVSH